MRRCGKCGDLKDLEAFHRNKNKPGGRHVVCKACAIETSRKWREANPRKGRQDFHKPWTPDEMRQLVILRRMGRTIVEISDILERTDKSVENAIVYFGLQVRKQNRGVHTVTVLRAAKKYGPEKAAKILGLSPGTVYRRLRRCKSYPTHPTRGRRVKKAEAAS